MMPGPDHESVVEPPILETSRLVLRPWRDEDREPFAVLNADPVVMRHFPAPLTTAESNAFVDRAILNWERGFGLWAVQRRDDTTCIGFIGLSQPQWEAPFTPCIEIGWRLAASTWGNGFAPEGARAVLAWARQHVVVPGDEVVSFTTTGNIASRRVMEKLGMNHDAADDFDHPLLSEWPHRRHVLYRLQLAARDVT